VGIIIAEDDKRKRKTNMQQTEASGPPDDIKSMPIL
jgi:hypothetical protein